MTSLSVMHISFAELCASVNIDQATVYELVEYRIIRPDTGNVPEEWLFNAAAVSVVKKALRLQRDLQIDLADVALVVKLLEENAALQEENTRLKQRLGRFEIDNSDA
jgi:chaperone modulatory protein CbpM